MYMAVASGNLKAQRQRAGASRRQLNLIARHVACRFLVVVLVDWQSQLIERPLNLGWPEPEVQGTYANH